MKRLTGITAAVLLLGAGTALADHGFGGDGLSTVRGVSGAFAATTASNVRTTTCTGSDGATYAITRATYTGTATSTEPALNGTATIDANAVIDTTHDLGTVSGTLRIDTGSGHTDVSFDAVYGAGTAAGLAEGKGDGAGGALVANLSAAYTAAGGFANGKLGGTSGGGAVLTSRGGCRQGTQTTPRTERIDVRGSVSAVSATSITAAGVTCAVPSALASSVAGLKVGDFVRLSCTSTAGVETLASASPDAGGKGGGSTHEGRRR